MILDPFPSMLPPSEKKTFEAFFQKLLPHLFGEDALHHCGYRNICHRLIKKKIVDTIVQTALGMSDPLLFRVLA